MSQLHISCSFRSTSDLRTCPAHEESTVTGPKVRTVTVLQSILTHFDQSFFTKNTHPWRRPMRDRIAVGVRFPGEARFPNVGTGSCPGPHEEGTLPGTEGPLASGNVPFSLRTQWPLVMPHMNRGIKTQGCLLVCLYLCKGPGVLPGPPTAAGRSQVVSHRRRVGLPLSP